MAPRNRREGVTAGPPATLAAGIRAAGPAALLMIAAACTDAPEPRADGGAGAADAGSAAYVPEPSFDCDAPGLGEVELRICADSALSALDARLADVWVDALDRARGTAMPSTWVDEMRAYQRGWVAGRDDCWKAPGEAAYANVTADVAIRRCTESAYVERIARLEAQWGIAEQTGGPVFWACDGNPANEFVTTFYATDPPAAKVDRGDQSEVFLRTPTASGTRYAGLFGKSFRSRGDTAVFVWPRADSLDCVVRARGADAQPADTAGGLDPAAAPDDGRTEGRD